MLAGTFGPINLNWLDVLLRIGAAILLALARA